MCLVQITPYNPTARSQCGFTKLERGGSRNGFKLLLLNCAILHLNFYFRSLPCTFTARSSQGYCSVITPCSPSPLFVCRISI